MSSTVTAPTTDASLLTAGVIPAARLATGTADDTTFLCGDRTWAVPDGGGGDPATGPANQVLATPDGSDGEVEVRAIVPADVPALPTSKITGLDAALAAKAPLASPALTGTPTAPTASGGTNTTQLATTAFVRAEVAALVNSAPGTLDTLGEIATQLAADESTAAALATTVGGKLAKSSNLSDLTNAGTARTNLGLATVAATGSAADLTGTLATARLPTGIDAAKLADGSVSNTEFQYLNGVTSGIQGQIDALAGGGGSYLPLGGGTMTGAIDMDGHDLADASSVTTTGSYIATGYTSFFGTGVNFGWLSGYSAAEFQSLDGGYPAPMFFDATDVWFRGAGYAALATLDADGLTMPSGGVVESPAGFVGPGTCPTGCILPYGGTVAPDGWLLCNGDSVSRAGYPDLFATIGETYGPGDSYSTFTLPDFTDRGPIGPGTYALGTQIGDWAPSAAVTAGVTYGSDATVATEYANNPPRSTVTNFIIKT